MANLLHISSNVYPSLEQKHTTMKIWDELAKGFDEYHILARSEDNKFHTYQKGDMHLHLVPKWGRARSFIVSSLYMFKIVKKFKIDVMLSQCPIFGGSLATFISKRKDIPLMVEIHGMEYFRMLDSKSLVNKCLTKLMRYSFNNATKIRSLNSKMTELLHERSITKNIVEINNRVNTEIFNLPKADYKLSKPIEIISVGRFVWEKNYEVAIKAVKSLSESTDIKLRLIGGGPLKASYEQLIGDNKSVVLYDKMPQEEFVTMLNKADIYIQPSISEGMPRTIFEAMAIGLPIISTDVGAITGVIKDKVNGIVINSTNESKLKEAILQLIDDEVLREKIGQMAYHEATTKYEWSIMFELYRKELLDMLD